jgi:hypothetical protein
VWNDHWVTLGVIHVHMSVQHSMHSTPCIALHKACNTQICLQWPCMYVSWIRIWIPCMNSTAVINSPHRSIDLDSASGRVMFMTHIGHVHVYDFLHSFWDSRNACWLKYKWKYRHIYTAACSSLSHLKQSLSSPMILFMFEYICVCVHAQTYTFSRRIHTHTHTHTCTHIRKKRYLKTKIHPSYLCIQPRRTQTDTHTLSLSHTHKHAKVLSPEQRKHAHTRTQTRVRAHTYTQKHTQSCIDLVTRQNSNISRRHTHYTIRCPLSKSITIHLM